MIQGPKNAHTLLMTVWIMSCASDLVAQMLLILKKTIFDLIIRVLDITVQKEMASVFVWGQSVAETCFSHWGYFQYTSGPVCAYKRPADFKGDISPLIWCE